MGSVSGLTGTERADATRSGYSAAASAARRTPARRWSEWKGSGASEGGRRLTLADFVDEYLAQHEVSPVTLMKLRFLLIRTIESFGGYHLDELDGRSSTRSPIGSGRVWERRCSLPPRPACGRANGWPLSTTTSTAPTASRTCAVLQQRQTHLSQDGGEHPHSAAPDSCARGARPLAARWSCPLLFPPSAAATSTYTTSETATRSPVRSRLESSRSAASTISDTPSRPSPECHSRCRARQLRASASSSLLPGS
jgi:hypothetical protein